MNKTRDKMTPGARMFGNAMESIRNPSQSRKPKPLGLKEIKNTESTSPKSSSPTETTEASISVFQNPSSTLLDETQNFPSVKNYESSPETVVTKEDEFVTPLRQQAAPPGFHNPLNIYSPPNSQVYPSTASFDLSSVQKMYPTDFYSPLPEVLTNYPSPSWDNFMTPMNYSMHQYRYLTPLPSPPSNQEKDYYYGTLPSHEGVQQSLYSFTATDLNPCSMDSHEELRQSLYSMTATDLALRMSEEQPKSPSDCNLPSNSQDSGCLLSDDNDSSETSTVDSHLFSGMSYYHMANTSELPSAEKQIQNEIPPPEKQITNEVPPAEKNPEPKQAPDTLISSRVNRRNVSRIQGANTCISSAGNSYTALRLNRANLPQSVAKYSSTDDSGADVSTDEDLLLSPSYEECRSCDALSKRVSSGNAQQRWKSLPDYGRTQFLSLRCVPGFIDSHCHLDFLLGRQNFEGTYSEYMHRHRGTYPASYEGCVAVFCHPDTFHKRNMWEKYLGENGVWGAFGCHPHHSKFYNSTAEHHLINAIHNSKVRALGEIGLDYSDRNDCSTALQHRVFRRQLYIALDEQLPLVIHCRDANEDTMRIMKEILPRDYVIHLHCFTDGWDWAEKWLKEFPNLCIGITNLVTFPSAEETHDVVKRIPLDRLLLETDAPYFIPRKVARTTRNTKHSHPGMAIHVAAQIAALRGVSLKEIIYHTRENTRKVYGI